MHCGVVAAGKNWSCLESGGKVEERERGKNKRLRNDGGKEIEREKMIRGQDTEIKTFLGMAVRPKF